MAGWRVGMVAADADVIAQILKVKSQMDSGMFKPLQLAAVQALSQGAEWFEQLNDEYRRRRVFLLFPKIFFLVLFLYRSCGGSFVVMWWLIFE